MHDRPPRNIALIAGFVLPVLAMAIFFGGALLRDHAPPPEYDVLLTVPDYAGNREKPITFALKIENGVLMADYGKNANQSQKLYRFDVKNRSLQEIKLTPPIETAGMTLREALPATRGLKLLTETRAPDGYEFVGAVYDSASGFFGGMLLGSHDRVPALVKDGTRIPLPTKRLPNAYAFSNATFLGWVAP